MPHEETAGRPALFESHLPGHTLWRRGKVRDVYDLGDRLLIVATDRISAFDVVLPTPIPDKGRVLTQISLFWFQQLADVVLHHVITANVDEYPASLQPFRDQLEGRSMLVARTEPLPVECVVRGHITGSGWKDYKATGQVCGIPLPAGLRESDELHPAIFTPSTKAEVGHDENIAFDAVVSTVGAHRAAELRDTSLALYERARRFAAERGILLADTKFEFGVLGGTGAEPHPSAAGAPAGPPAGFTPDGGNPMGGRLVWIDEALTPDSSRFWPRDGFTPGGPQPSFDKQFVRDWLEAQRWDKRPPAPALPADVVARTRDKYREAFLRLTGRELD
ncbi:MAG: phosphoribosylaminoimidazolesuccinocarboxamide synthase [Vicinamibacteria bacterium]|jgi:phosphoribosylaminoimidazole-succinocarboxamide synthase|nr:phosphoribosylaminoimidazolesuccinocarboxamide synthase [Vicinamibacteria bacterium]